MPIVRGRKGGRAIDTVALARGGAPELREEKEEEEDAAKALGLAPDVEAFCPELEDLPEADNDAEEEEKDAVEEDAADTLEARLEELL